VVREGKIVPHAPLSEGLQVQITVPEDIVIAEELQADLNAWSRRNAEALDMVEQLAEEMARHEKACGLATSLSLRAEPNASGRTAGSERS